MNNDLISREALKETIMNDLGLGDEENGSDAEYMSGLQDCYNLIDNAPSVSDRYGEGYAQGYIDGSTGADMRGDDE